MEKKRKKRRGSKKGTPFERQMAREFSLWFSCGKDDNIFWRTSQSGGRATTRAKAGKSSNLHRSDLCAIDPLGEPLTRLMIIELKKGYSKKSIHDLLDKPHKDVAMEHEQWFAKAERDRQSAGAVYWLIVHQRDYRQPLVFFPTRFCLPFNKINAIELFGPPALEYWFEIDAHLESVSAVPLATFFTKIHPSQIILLSRDMSLKEEINV